MKQIIKSKQKKKKKTKMLSSLVSITAPSSSQKRVWRKILYEKQPFYSDNFYDPDKFLDTLQAQTKKRPLTYFELIISCSYIIQQFTIMTIFFTIYKYLVVGRLRVYHLLAINITSTISGIIIFHLLEENFNFRNSFRIWKYLRSIFIFVVCLRTAAPLLQSLTYAFSDDTVHAIVLILASIHLVFYEYADPTNVTSAFGGTSGSSDICYTDLLSSDRNGHINDINERSMSNINDNSNNNSIYSSFTDNVRVSTSTSADSNLYVTPTSIDMQRGILSLNAAMFTSVILASRLKSIGNVVGLCLLAVLLFVGFPEIARLIQRKSTIFHLVLTLCLYLVAGYLLFYLESNTLFFVYQVLVLLVVLVACVWFSYMQNFKKSMHGPWDEAKVQ